MHLGYVFTNYTYLGGPVIHCAPGVRLLASSWQFNTPCKALCRERNFRTPSVRICTVHRSRTRTPHLVCVFTNYTYLGGTVAHCASGVRLRDRSRQFATPYTALCSELYFRTHAVRVCIVPRSRTRTVHKLYLPGRSRSALFTRCTTPRLHRSVQHTVFSYLQRTVVSYTCCTEQYSSPK